MRSGWCYAAAVVVMICALVASLLGVWIESEKWWFTALILAVAAVLSGYLGAVISIDEAD